MNEDDISLIAEMLKSHAWKLYEDLNKIAAENYRFLATQQPEVIPQEMRTWYSALAKGREEAIEHAKQIIQKVL